MSSSTSDLTQQLPTVALVGRPNVGKSTLFNRLAGKKLALVHNYPGVTRDWREAQARLGGLRFRILDTAGLDEDTTNHLTTLMHQQTLTAIEQADIILFIIDIRTGVTPLDRHFASLIRKSNKPTILIANKAEGKESAWAPAMAETHQLGFEDPMLLSAEHNHGMSYLYESLAVLLPKNASAPEKKDKGKAPLQLAVVGRPNVGKSTLINAWLKQDRVLTSDIPGVTRDAIAIDWTYRNHPIRLIDTAGMRRRPKVSHDLEKLAISDSLRSIKYAQVVVLVIEPQEGLSKQDANIANTVINEGRILIIALNKWDQVKNKDKFIQSLNHRLEKVLPQIKGVPCVPISALYNKKVDQLLDEALKLYQLWNKRVTTGLLNQWLAAVLAHHPPPMAGRARLKLKYLTQIKTRPPTFTVFTNKPTEVPDSYARYLQNTLREAFGLWGIPIRIKFKGGENPYVKK